MGIERLMRRLNEPGVVGEAQVVVGTEVQDWPLHAINSCAQHQNTSKTLTAYIHTCTARQRPADALTYLWALGAGDLELGLVCPSCPDVGDLTVQAVPKRVVLDGCSFRYEVPDTPIRGLPPDNASLQTSRHRPKHSTRM